MQLQSKWGNSSWQNWDRQFRWLTVPETKWGHAAKTTKCYTRVKCVIKRQFSQGQSPFYCSTSETRQNLLLREVCSRMYIERKPPDKWKGVYESESSVATIRFPSPICDFVFIRNCAFKGASCQISLLANLHKTTQLSVNHEGKNHNALSGRQQASKRSREIRDEEQWIISTQELWNQEIIAVRFRAFKPLSFTLTNIHFFEWDLKEQVLDISEQFSRIKKKEKGIWGSPRGTQRVMHERVFGYTSPN